MIEEVETVVQCYYMCPNCGYVKTSVLWADHCTVKICIRCAFKFILRLGEPSCNYCQFRIRCLSLSTIVIPEAVPLSEEVEYG